MSASPSKPDIAHNGSDVSNGDGKADVLKLSLPQGGEKAHKTPTPTRTPQNPVRLEAGMSAGHAVLTMLTADITAVPGVGPSVATKLRSLGIKTIHDLLFYFPREHRDYSKLTKIASIPINEVTTTKGIIWEVEMSHTGGKRSRTIATISDETGKIRVTWFNQPYLSKQLNAAKGSYLVVTGVKQRFGNKVEFTVRSHELPEQGDLLNTGRMVPTYALTEGLHAKTLRRFTKWAVDHYAAMVPDHYPPPCALLASCCRCRRRSRKFTILRTRRCRLLPVAASPFDELFLIQLGMQERRSRWQLEAPQGNGFHIDLSKVFIDAGDTGETDFNRR